MSKNIKVDGKTYKDVKTIKAVDSDTGALDTFYETSDATASVYDVMQGKSAYINGGMKEGRLSLDKEEVSVELDMSSGDQSIFPTDPGKFIGKATVVKPDTFIPENIAENVNIGGIVGTFRGGADLDGIVDGTLAEFEMPQGKTEIYKYRFTDFQNLTSVSLGSVTKIGDHAFDGCTKVETFSAIFNLSELGDSAFSKFGGARTQNNQFNFDFSDSTITAVPQKCFGSEDSANVPKNLECRFPASINQIGGSAFRYAKDSDFYFSSTEKAPTVSELTTWSNTSNVRIFCPVDNINGYRTATNWATMKNSIVGYLPENTYSVGISLPTINEEGYELSWYKDKNCTESVTTVESADTPYYCKAGEERKVFKILSVSTKNCTVTITDGVTNYAQGDKVNRDTVLTITCIPESSAFNLAVFTVNGVSFTSGDTITVTADIVVVAAYSEMDPVFGNNDWSQIMVAFKSGIASTLWNVGDTKKITSISGKEYTIRIADMQEGRYTYATGEPTHGVLEFVELINLNETKRFDMNSSGSNAGGFAQSRMKTVHLPDILADLPVDMQEAIGEINVLSGTGSGTTSGTSSSVCKLFLPAEMEMFDAKNYSIGLEECPKGQFDYYKEHNTSGDRKKQDVGTTNYYYYWLRSPSSGTSGYFCDVDSGGSYGSIIASNAAGVAPCFAI